MTFPIFSDLPVELQDKIVTMAIQEETRSFKALETFKPNNDPDGEPTYGWTIQRPLLPAVIRAVPGALTAAKNIGIIVPMLRTGFSTQSLFLVESDWLHINSKLTANASPPVEALQSGLHDPTDFALIKRISFDGIDLFYYNPWVQANIKCFPGLERIDFLMDIILPMGAKKIVEHIDIELQPRSKKSKYKENHAMPVIKLPSDKHTVKVLKGMGQLSRDYIPFPQMQTVNHAWSLVERLWKYNKKPHHTLRLTLVEGKEGLARQRNHHEKQAAYARAARNLHARMILQG